MLCQTCSAFNEDEREFCYRCQNKLLVLSGLNSFEEDDLEGSDVILPPPDLSFAEAASEFTGEGLIPD